MTTYGLKLKHMLCWKGARVEMATVILKAEYWVYYYIPII